ncbi:hypothetical protein OROGR_001550 [Orobanche gracilis]
MEKKDVKKLSTLYEKERAKDKKEDLKEKKDDLRQLENDIFNVSEDSGHVFGFIISSQIFVDKFRAGQKMDHATMWSYLLVSVLLGVVALIKLSLVFMHHNELLHKKDVEFDKLHPQELRLRDRYW